MFIKTTPFANTIYRFKSLEFFPPFPNIVLIKLRTFRKGKKGEDSRAPFSKKQKKPKKQTKQKQRKEKKENERITNIWSSNIWKRREKFFKYFKQISTRWYGTEGDIYLSYLISLVSRIGFLTGNEFWGLTILTKVLLL